MIRAVSTLQDAFNTASFPGLPRKGLVLIRQFDVGAFPATLSATALSRRIDEGIRLLAGGAVCVDEEEQAHEAVVWFRDTVQPYVALASLMARGETPRAWYWPRAIPSLSISDNPKANLSDLLRASVHTKSGFFATSRIVQSLLEQGHLDRLLTSFEEEDASFILNYAGISPNWNENRFLESESVPPAPSLPAPVHERLIKWCHVWGAKDARSAWLSYIMFIHANPSFLTSSRSSRVVQSFVRKIVKNYRQHQSIRSRSKPRQKPIGPNQDSDPKNLPQAEEPATKTSPLQRKLFPFKQKISLKKAHISPKEVGPTKLDWHGSDQDHKHHSEYSGFLFLIPLLELIGIREILASHPALAECNLPSRLLGTLAHRFKIPKEDPILSFLSEVPALEAASPFDFLAPESWQPIIFSSHQESRRIETQVIQLPMRKQMLRDRRGRHLLALWRGEDRPVIKQWMQGKTTSISETREIPDIERIQKAMTLILSVHLRRMADISLRSLIFRPGAVAVTPTHIDLMFGLNQADIRIRKAGLDINPGWVSWLGRVIQFHYDEEGS